MADFGQNRLWPKPTLANPTLAKPTLTCGVVCGVFVCGVFVCLCVAWVLVSRFHGVGFHVWVLVWSCTVPPGPPFPRSTLPGTALPGTALPGTAQIFPLWVSFCPQVIKQILNTIWCFQVQCSLTRPRRLGLPVAPTVFPLFSPGPLGCWTQRDEPASRTDGNPLRQTLESLRPVCRHTAVDHCWWRQRSNSMWQILVWPRRMSLPWVPRPFRLRWWWNRGTPASGVLQRQSFHVPSYHVPSVLMDSNFTHSRRLFAHTSGVIGPMLLTKAVHRRRMDMQWWSLTLFNQSRTWATIFRRYCFLYVESSSVDFASKMSNSSMSATEICPFQIHLHTLHCISKHTLQVKIVLPNWWSLDWSFAELGWYSPLHQTEQLGLWMFLQIAFRKVCSQLPSRSWTCRKQQQHSTESAHIFSSKTGLQQSSTSSFFYSAKKNRLVSEPLKKLRIHHSMSVLIYLTGTCSISWLFINHCEWRLLGFPRHASLRDRPS